MLLELWYINYIDLDAHDNSGGLKALVGQFDLAVVLNPDIGWIISQFDEGQDLSDSSISSKQLTKYSIKILTMNSHNIINI